MMVEWKSIWCDKSGWVKKVDGLGWVYFFDWMCEYVGIV